ncbi:hypothetical protein RMSM_06329 [Rhodopirellula maiorica SM1]|uniref:Uncharacterized protein n=1 Tax=Rhodopirellula maiorica SM1 TaxID=1265738 RepID=M5RS12_9BACT|nr:hypothetical protein RMSM_06329 [Rhodopirellula maiorica SM1]
MACFVAFRSLDRSEAMIRDGGGDALTSPLLPAGSASLWAI